jgi:hypothetical protein
MKQTFPKCCVRWWNKLFQKNVKERKREGRGKEGGKREEGGQDERVFWRIKF